ncbi:hypothetical protein AXE80_03565 [Wenyingzhuangia fucanilytica]|uniref:Secretion system C-terminal sorting domain-containing protein n=1 Tax=Wenyingzhuangia fucanilytica TaxID=1790137 RepID=A0A1B1Y3R1_9FLAO|nr:leucine-rich repeat domain-containing protein [Wenyingzhuangia fucanilytica]ANW95412.1 hypothetical protein AXE80_03565 [Wenyingzhuangia fucanilytica]
MKRKVQLFWTALFAVCIVNAQTVGDVFMVNDVNYTVTSLSPNEVELGDNKTSLLTSIIVPTTIEDTNTSTTYTVTAIGENAFNTNDNITYIELPASVTEIKYRAFAYADGIETINFTTTSGVTILGRQAFFTCAISDVNELFELIEEVGQGCFSRANLTNTFSTAASLTNLVESANFRENEMEIVDLSASTSLTTLPASSFILCPNIVTVKLPLNLTSIGASTFDGCTSLNEMEVEATDPSSITVDASAFTGSGIATATLYVPVGSKSAYEVADVWKDFGTIVEGDITLSTNEVEKEFNFNIYPNPTSDVVTINSNQLNDASVSVYDITGELLFVNKLEGSSSNIDISNLISGVYMFKIETSKGQFTKRIIKE